MNGRGVQVLYVEGNSYRVDEAALDSVTQQEATRGLPVAVVSVAGIMRSGKSFLLGFFLRYLHASEAEQRSGAWLGDPDQPLEGFRWHFGCNTDTQGIILWSEPIIVTRGTGANTEKVAVVLMDTQGTFDTKSTVGNCATIFGMSTLLSSVQIYNLKQNIQENDFQFLELFTQYGKLAQDQGVTCPFQELHFLVRDWSCPYQYPHGAEGGEGLLNERLEIREGQANQLKDIRQYVRSTFQKLRCTLMPDPSITVGGATSDQFRGTLSEISAGFKNALLELVPSIFESNNLIVKTVNGQNITIQDFAVYFKTYIGIFNSGTIPEPASIMEMMSSVCLERAASASRSVYVSHMERGTAGRVPRAALPRLHSAALLAARAVFAERRTLAAPARATERLDALLQELDDMLPNYVAINSGKISTAITASKDLYRAIMASLDTCLAPAEIAERHDAASAAARADFATSRADGGDGDDDEDWETLRQELERTLPMYREMNEGRIVRAEAVACQVYEARMRGGRAAAPCLHPRSLSELHRAATDAAIDAFLPAWRNAETALTARFLRDIRDSYREIETDNNAANQQAVEEVLAIYTNRMFQVCNETTRCLHPRDLETAHGRAQAEVFGLFWQQRDLPGRYRQPDQYRENIEMELAQLLPIYRNMNMEKIARADAAATDLYEARMRDGRAGAPCMHPLALRELHRAAKEAALTTLLMAWDQQDTALTVTLMTYIRDRYRAIERENSANDQRAADNAIDFYSNQMTAAFTNDSSRCFHPRDLEVVHERTQTETIASFLQQRQGVASVGQADSTIQAIIRDLPRACTEFQQRNKSRNNDSVTRAYDCYESTMNPDKTGLKALLDLVSIDTMLFNRHANSQSKAFDLLKESRLPGGSYIEDCYKDSLKEKIDVSFCWVLIKNCTKAVFAFGLMVTTGIPPP